MRFSRLEEAILAWFVDRCEDPAVVDHLRAARLKSRDHTGVGLFVHLDCLGEIPPAAEGASDSYPLPGPDISCAKLPHGAGSVLFVTEGIPDVLEIFSYGDSFSDELGDFKLSDPPSPS